MFAPPPSRNPALLLGSDVDPDDLSKVTDKTRTLGLCVCRHASIVMIAPEEGIKETDNPFAVPDDA